MNKPFMPEMPCPHCGQNLKLPADITDRFNKLESARGREEMKLLKEIIRQILEGIRLGFTRGMFK